jgi:Mn-dependent DtxR family transcriptional regulator
MTEELREKILKYLDTVSQARNKEVARAIGMEKGLVDKAIGDLAKEGKIEYRSFGESPISPFPESTRPK